MARVFSGIQPTGIPHLGNYFGALLLWRQLAAERSHSPINCDKPIYCVADVHAYGSPSLLDPDRYQKILSTTAALYAIGLNPDNCIIFRQSDITKHNYLKNVFEDMISIQRLSHMTQYKDKLAKSKTITTKLLTYPLLQAADILLYGANLVPIGEDQMQHIELTRDIARKFNIITNSDTFVVPEPLLNESVHARRIMSLREPHKKMSKSDNSELSFIQIVDEPDQVLEKLKKAMTDSISDIYFDPKLRPGVSNLMRIHQLVTGDSFEEIRDNFRGKQTAEYKLALAEIIIEHLKPIRLEYNRIRNDTRFLMQILSIGLSRAEPIADDTYNKVRQLLGSTGGEF